jgi:hypothetical protein
LPCGARLSTEDNIGIQQRLRCVAREFARLIGAIMKTQQNQYLELAWTLCMAGLLQTPAVAKARYRAERR